MDTAGDVDAGSVPELPGEPGNGAAVVAVGGGNDGQRSTSMVVGHGHAHGP